MTEKIIIGVLLPAANLKKIEPYSMELIKNPLLYGSCGIVMV